MLRIRNSWIDSIDANLMSRAALKSSVGPTFIIYPNTVNTLFFSSTWYYSSFKTLRCMHVRTNCFSAYDWSVYFPDKVDETPGEVSIALITSTRAGYLLIISVTSGQPCFSLSMKSWHTWYWAWRIIVSSCSNGIILKELLWDCRWVCNFHFISRLPRIWSWT